MIALPARFCRPPIRTAGTAPPSRSPGSAATFSTSRPSARSSPTANSAVDTTASAAWTPISSSTRTGAFKAQAVTSSTLNVVWHAFRRTGLQGRSGTHRTQLQPASLYMSITARASSPRPASSIASISASRLQRELLFSTGRQIPDFLGPTMEQFSIWDHRRHRARLLRLPRLSRRFDARHLGQFPPLRL